MFLFENIKKILPLEIANHLKNAPPMGELQEIRIRAERPLFVKTQKGIFFIEEAGQAYIVKNHQMREIVQRLSGYSLYAFEEELKQGYLTIEGGHRVGFCGRAVLEEGKVKTLRQVSSLNIRIAREVKGCGEKWLPFLLENNRICHTLIVSPPGCGKTTLLRDLIRLLSTGDGARPPATVGVVDERGEIAAMKDGVAQMDIGPCTDVQENCPKAEGMVFLLRSMAPDVIAVDEMGKERDFAGMEEMMHAGVRLISTVHGSSMAELCRNPRLCRMIEQKTMERYLFLSGKRGVGTVEGIFNGEGEAIYERRDEP